ncbi:hypothetical protein BDZ89DRAFT_1119450 [Hymenopellis radicata]|nr:hypothetical protein BDZ89DRAFT_1119450 [Hymenopellis radicata]
MGQGELNSPSEESFFVDVFPSTESTWAQSGWYQPHSADILGEKPNEELHVNANKSRCFNCGSLEHVVSSCPEPRDSALVALSRQMYEFHKDSTSISFGERLHLVEESRRQRLGWLETFKPGQITGDLLRDAIHPGDGDWLKHIAIWGYPKGWSSSCDPRIEIRKRILNEWSDDDTFHSDLSIIMDENDVEEGSSFAKRFTPATPTQTEIDDDPEASDLPEQRWAEYPNTEFSSSLLPLYTGFALPPPGSEFEERSNSDSTYSFERRALWNHLTSYSGRPPPPPSAPPPLPPPPPPPTSEPPPLPPPTSLQSFSSSQPVIKHTPVYHSFIPRDDDDDMDLSD